MKAPANSPQRPLRVGLFGGTFNPIHKGHLRVAEDVQQRTGLDCIYFIPSASPPHKCGSRLAPARHRLEMVRLTVDANPCLKVCDIELKREGSSYSIDTVLQCKAQQLAGGELFFLVGMDAFFEIHTWRRFKLLFAQTAFIVMSRPGIGQWDDAMLGKLKAYVHDCISHDYRWDPASVALIHPQCKAIQPISVTPVDITSTQVRERIAVGRDYQRWMIPEAAKYIEEKGLYR
ncbi:MAG: nicotinate (nicotinamide) nucleotide adenylyltransferase [Desulfatitalea sp.]|nr:nicotinate-nucleotide adenylyltransferase [Desulfatitalea sp.]NNK01452.1 nicotinate (nicotinamide) nucleotide adenylyltransferase [Desulfatitalea sp.]